MTIICVKLIWRLVLTQRQDTIPQLHPAPIRQGLSNNKYHKSKTHPSRATPTTHQLTSKIATYKISTKKIISRGKATPNLKETNLVGKIKSDSRMKRNGVTTSDATNTSLEGVVPTRKPWIPYQVSTNRQKEAQHKSKPRLIETSGELSETAPSKWTTTLTTTWLMVYRDSYRKCLNTNVIIHQANAQFSTWQECQLALTLTWCMPSKINQEFNRVPIRSMRCSLPSVSRILNSLSKSKTQTGRHCRQAFHRQWQKDPSPTNQSHNTHRSPSWVKTRFSRNSVLHPSTIWWFSWDQDKSRKLEVWSMVEMLYPNQTPVHLTNLATQLPQIPNLTTAKDQPPIDPLKLPQSNLIE